jgi:hypothetical protein
MRLRQFCWVLWVVGTALIVMSWFGLVPPPVGWIGFVVSLVGVVVSYIPQPEDRSAYPLTQEGFPVEPSGIPVPPDVPLEAGAPLLAYSGGRWWRATVIAVEGDKVEVCFPGWDTSRRERIPRKYLQIDPDPNRAPLQLPPEGWLDRKAEQPNPEGVRRSPDSVKHRPEDE